MMKQSKILLAGKKLLVATVFTIGLTQQSFAGGGGDIFRASIMIDNFEYQFNDEKALSWDTFAYGGYDLDKVYLYSEGEKPENGDGESENQLVFSRAISPYWDLQAGIGYDKKDDAHQTWAVLGIQGLAPYFFETRVVLLFGEDDNIGLRAETEYEALLTQKLILTPSVALDAYTKDNDEMGIGSGLSNLTLGARLRYEIRREFAPYIGVEWNKNLGNTDTLNPSNETYVAAGLRVWF